MSTTAKVKQISSNFLFALWLLPPQFCCSFNVAASFINRRSFVHFPAQKLVQQMSKFCWWIPILLLFFLPKSNAKGGCPVAELQKCAEPLRALGVPLSKNLIRLLLQIASPTKLLKSCQAYSSVMPCFHSKVAECGNSAQREILRQLTNALQFICSPFSAQQQSNLMVHRICIGRVLGQSSAQGQCQNDGNAQQSAILHQCREQCLPKMGTFKFACLIRTWLSEQNICMLAKMRAECGKEAATFYTQMQKEIFHPKFPLICADGNGENGGKGKAENAEIKAQEKQSKQSTPPSIIVPSKKNRMKKVAKLSEIRFKFGVSKRTTTKMPSANSTIKGGMAIPSSTIIPKMSNKTMGINKKSTSTTQIPPKPNINNNSNNSTSIPPKLPQTIRPTNPIPIIPFPLATIPPPSVKNNKFQSRKNSTVAKKKVNLLAQSVPFILFPTSTSAQSKSTNSPIERMFFAAPNPTEWINQFKNTRLVFFEVTPIDEQFKKGGGQFLDFSGGKKAQK